MEEILDQTIELLKNTKDSELNEFAFISKKLEVISYLEKKLSSLGKIEGTGAFANTKNTSIICEIPEILILKFLSSDNSLVLQYKIITKNPAIKKTIAHVLKSLKK